MSVSLSPSQRNAAIVQLAEYAPAELTSVQARSQWAEQTFDNDPSAALAFLNGQGRGNFVYNTSGPTKTGRGGWESLGDGGAPKDTKVNSGGFGNRFQSVDGRSGRTRSNVELDPVQQEKLKHAAEATAAITDKAAELKEKVTNASTALVEAQKALAEAIEDLQEKQKALKELYKQKATMLDTYAYAATKHDAIHGQCSNIDEGKHLKALDKTEKEVLVALTGASDSGNVNAVGTSGLNKQIEDAEKAIAGLLGPSGAIATKKKEVEEKITAFEQEKTNAKSEMQRTIAAAKDEGVKISERFYDAQFDAIKVPKIVTATLDDVAQAAADYETFQNGPGGKTALASLRIQLVANYARVSVRSDDTSVKSSGQNLVSSFHGKVQSS